MHNILTIVYYFEIHVRPYYSILHHVIICSIPMTIHLSELEGAILGESHCTQVVETSPEIEEAEPAKWVAFPEIHILRYFYKTEIQLYTHIGLFPPNM